MNLISSSPVRLTVTDFVDEHFYSSPEYFRYNSNRYDRYDRRGPKILVGELACNMNAGNGNLVAALAEAGFMIGCERNSDVVAMVAYAPLFANANVKQWNPNAIIFNNSNQYGTPSYYVQKLFAESRGDRLVASELSCNREKIYPMERGGVGLRTFKCTAEFANATVVNSHNVTLLSSEYASGAAPWHSHYGRWETKQGVYHQLDEVSDGGISAGDASWLDYRFSVDVKKVSGDGSIGVQVRLRDIDRWLMLRLGGSQNTIHTFERNFPSLHGWHTDGSPDIVDSIAGVLEAGRWHKVSVEAVGRRIICYLDGRRLFDINEAYANPDVPVMSAIANTKVMSSEIILKVVNYSRQPQETQIKLEGIDQIEATGTATVLTSGNYEDENTFAEPNKVVPITKAIEGLGTNFNYRFSPFSITVLRLKQVR